MTPEAVIFDLDGTLADTSGDLVAAANACFRARGLGDLLDMNGDGNALDDILRMAGKAMPGAGTSSRWCTGSPALPDDSATRFMATGSMGLRP